MMGTSKQERGKDRDMVAIYAEKFNVIELVDGEGDFITDLSVLPGDAPDETLLSAGWEILGDWRPFDGGDKVADLIEV